MISTKLLSNFIEITLRLGCSPVNLLHIFRTPFLKNTSGWLLLVFSLCCLLSAEIFLQSFQKSFVIECYNHILLITVVLQAEFHKVLRFSSFKPRFPIDSSFFLFFLDLQLLQLVFKSFCLNS